MQTTYIKFCGRVVDCTLINLNVIHIFGKVSVFHIAINNKIQECRESWTEHLKNIDNY
jgi:hypothetical protein